MHRLHVILLLNPYFMSNSTRYILMLEDDSDDRYLTQHMLEELGIDISIRFLSNSEELFGYLQQHPAPMLMLIDYNAKPDNGLVVLQKLKMNSNYKKIPVVLLSDTKMRSFIDESYHFGACTYIQKPRSLAETRIKIETFFKYWLDVAEV